MGKNDKKSKKGKIHIGSYGVRRRRKASNKIVTNLGASETEKVKKEVVAKAEKVEKAPKAEKVEKAEKAEKPAKASKVTAPKEGE